MWIVLVALLITAVTPVLADVEGRMNCQVKSNRVTTVEEGKPKEFTGYEGKFVVGDSLTIIYENLFSNFSVIIEDRLRDDRVMTASVGSNDIDRSFHEPKYSEGILLRSKGIFADPRFVMSNPEFEMSVFANSDIISASNNLASIELERYYKNDWQGVYFQKINLALQITTLDCRHTRDRLDTFIEKLHFEQTKLHQKRIEEAKLRQKKALQENK